MFCVHLREWIMSMKISNRYLTRSLVAMAVLLGTASAHAVGTPVPGMGTWETTLQGRDLDGNLANGFEAYYDTDLNISWLADANYAATIGWVSPTFGAANGAMTYDEGMSLIKDLAINGITGWRAPELTDLGAPGCASVTSTGGTDCGYNVVPSSSEIVHLFSVTLGNHSVINPDGTRRATGDFGMVNSGPFVNIQKLGYGLGTPYAADPNMIWAFNPSSGIQLSLSKASGGYGWAVHDGDVGLLTSVPEPTSAALMLLGMVGVAAVARRKS
jgi:PEP-CTERM motif